MSEKTFLLNIFVKPKSRKNGFFMEQDHLVFYTTHAPVKGKINTLLLKTMSKSLKIPVNNLFIVRGYESRDKIILIRTNSYNTIDEIIVKLIGKGVKRNQI